MKVLLDECCPRPLRNALPDHRVFTVEMAGFKGLENGDLLRVVEGKFDVLVTADKNLRYQQNLADRKIAIIELPFNSWTRIKQLVPVINETINTIKPGGYIELPAPPNQPIL